MNTPVDMYVIKRDGSQEPVQFDKVLERMRKAASGLSVNYTRLAQLTLAEIHDGVTTTELDEIAARIAISYVTVHPDWGHLASQIILSNCQRNAPPTFSAAMEELMSLTNAQGTPTPALASDVMAFIRENADTLNTMVRTENDFLLDYFGFKTLERAYLLRGKGRKVVETPQYMWLRVAVGLWGTADLPLATRMGRIEETYLLMSSKAFTHATPTLFNSGTPRPQLSSCFLLGIGDSIEEIFDGLKQCAQISKYAGGIGLHIHNIRAEGTTIAGTQGKSNGIVPMLRVFNNTARYVDQCFTPETVVFATSEGISYANAKPISEVCVGDLVETTGTNEIVDETGKHWAGTSETKQNRVTKVVTHNYDGDLMEVSMVEHDTVTRVTPLHPVLTQMPNGEYDYVEIGKLQPGDRIAHLIGNDWKNEQKILTHEIASIQKTHYTGKLYDLEVEGTHDYNVCGFGYVHNGGGKRNGSFAIYLEPWHADVQAFLKMKSNTGSEEERARDLFYAMWIPDLFMKRVEAGGDWSLFCPHEAPGLADVYGDAFEALYERYEREGRAKRTIPAQKLWSEILVSQIETGTPYLLYKDAANKKSNQQNLGTIKSSNLCVAPETLLTVFDPPMDEGEGEWHGIPVGERKIRRVPIKDLHGDQVVIWNGESLSSVQVTMTNNNVQLLTVTVGQNVNGRWERSSLDCTPYHKFLLHHDGPVATAPRKEARELRPGDKLYTFTDHDGVTVEQEVITVEDLGRRDDTYCFNEPINHAGLFNGIFCGNCSEIIEYSDTNETAVCNLASVVLPHYIEGKRFNFDKLRQIVTVITRNLNRVIDINYYPTPETRRSNMRHRPIGIGVQGLADVFAELKMAWETPEAAALNQEIFENIYYAAVEMSAMLAEQDGAYETFQGSPASQGRLQPDLWYPDTSTTTYQPLTAGYLDWTGLRERVKRSGLRNSLLLAPMPTASTSQIMGYTESVEPITSNIYVRRTLAGEFTVVNKHLVRDLMALDLWSPQLKERIVAANGSVQGIVEIPAGVKARYKTVWEIKQKTLIDMAADRGAYICQSQSLNLFVPDPTIAKLSSMHFYGWRKGLKTGIYYLRTKSAVQAIKFTVDPSFLQGKAVTSLQGEVNLTLMKEKEPEECLLCSS